jgi:hypothetical protein
MNTIQYIKEENRKQAIAEIESQITSYQNNIDALERVKAIELQFIEKPNIVHEVAINFLELFYNSYSIYFISESIRKAVKEMYQKQYETTDELEGDIAKLLFRVFFSEGKDKVYDYNKLEFYNDKKCQALFDNGIYFPKEWLEQLVKCLVIKSPKEDMLLHNLTPEWMWAKVFKLLMELYQLTKLNIQHG